MANVDYPHGLNAVMSRFHDTPRMTKYYASVTTAIFRGDVVALKNTGRIHSLTTAGGDDEIIGIAAEYHPALTTPVSQIAVYDDPDTVYEVQSDGTTDPGTVATSVAHIGQTADLTIAAGSTASGQSIYELDYSDLGTTTNAPLKVVGLYQMVGNDVTLAHARYLVILQMHLNKGVKAVV